MWIYVEAKEVLNFRHIERSDNAVRSFAMLPDLRVTSQDTRLSNEHVKQLAGKARLTLGKVQRSLCYLIGIIGVRIYPLRTWSTNYNLHTAYSYSVGYSMFRIQIFREKFTRTVLEYSGRGRWIVRSNKCVQRHDIADVLYMFILSKLIDCNFREFNNRYKFLIYVFTIRKRFQKRFNGDCFVEFKTVFIGNNILEILLTSRVVDTSSFPA